MKRLLIVGAGGFGREVANWAESAAAAGAPWHPAGFLDDNPDALAGKVSPLPLLGSITGFMATADSLLVIAVGVPAIRRQLHGSLLSRGAEFANVVHPNAVVASGARLGNGVILAPYAVVSADARLGDGVVLNFHAVAQHDAVLGAWSQLNSHADVGGGSMLGAEVLVGTHAVVPARTSVPDRSIVLPGCVFQSGG